MTPGWILDLLAAIMLVVAAGSLIRMAMIARQAAGPRQLLEAHADSDAGHVLMGIAMAGMFTASLATLPAAAWAVIFGVLTAWFAVRAGLAARAAGIGAVAGSRCTLHLVHSAAMLYMFLALKVPATGSGSGGMSGMSMGGGGGAAAMGTLAVPTLAGVFAVLLAAYCVWDLDSLSGGRYQLAAAGGPLPGAARLSGTKAGCEVIMGVAMALMLVIMI